MQRREFSRAAFGAWALAGGGALFAPGAQAQIGGFKAGSDYRPLDRTAPVDAPAGQIEVVEFFAYSCVHCFNFEPLLKAWIQQKPANVVVRRVPVAFNAAFEPLQKLFYALEAMGKLEALHDKVFQAIHVDRQRLAKADDITAFIAKQGVDAQQFTQAYNSFGVAGKAKRASQLQDAYQVEGTPALGVAGRYYIPGQAARTLQIANALVAEVRKG